jgi:hypothetical protein
MSQRSYGKHDMKNFFVSAGLLAIGVASLHADEYAPDFTAMDATKPWTVSGTLRGFYDDNISTSPNGHKQGSAGFEISPQASLIMPLQQTELGLRYTYGLYYYQQRENQGSNPIDQSHQVDLWVDHAFSQATEGKIQDSFISQQDPQLTSGGNSFPYRVQGNNIENVGTLSLEHEFSMLFSADLSYQNTWVDYQNSSGTIQNPSPAALLNSDQHSAAVTLNYVYLPDLTFMVSYNFAWTYYTANQPVGYYSFGGFQFLNEIYYSQNRDLMSHSVTVGAKYAATANLSITGQAGFTYNDNYNLASFDTQQAGSIQPAASVAVTYTYLPGDYVQVGLTEASIPVATSDPNKFNGSLTLYQQATVFYAAINQQITPKLTGSLTGNYQYATYVGGNSDGQSQNFASLGLNLAYAIDPWVSVDAGYNLYYLTSTAALPGYSRNIGYASVTASF